MRLGDLLGWQLDHHAGAGSVTGSAVLTGSRNTPRPGTRIVGVWRLMSFHEVDDTGQISEGPLGPDPRGILIYTDDGHVSVSMMRTSTGPAPNYMGYAGRWSLDGNRVVHQIQVSSRPDWVDIEQCRDASLEGDRLTIQATRTIDDRLQQRILKWQRVPSAG